MAESGGVRSSGEVSGDEQGVNGMRKIIAVALLGAIATTFAPAGAEHGARAVEGAIAAPAPNVSGVGVVTRHARCAYQLGGEASNGLVGWVEPVDDFGDGNHFFELTSTSGEADFDVVFYASLGTCDNDPSPTTLNSEDFVGEGDEAGRIPQGSTYAIIVFKSLGHEEAFTFSIS